MDHHLKTHPTPFLSLWVGQKLFEVRLNDRNYQVGDRLILQEWQHDPTDPNAWKTGGYLGRTVEALVLYILEDGFGLLPGYCIMSISVLGRRHARDTAAAPDVGSRA